MSGTGKTTILAELQKQGYLVIDADATGLCVWRNKATYERVEYGLDGRDASWLHDHGWYCDIASFASFLSYIREDKHVFVSGLVENIEGFSKLFDKIVILSIKDDMLVTRLNQRTNNHFAKKKEEQAYILQSQKDLLNTIKDGIYVDSSSTPDVVAREVLSLSVNK